MTFDGLFVERPKSGLLIPKGVETQSADEKAANDYRLDAISHASDLLKIMRAEEVASFLYTKSHSVDIIRSGK